MMQVVQWLRLALPKGPSRVDIFLPSSEGEKRSCFRNVVFQFLEFWMMDKVQNSRNSASVSFVKIPNWSQCLHHSSPAASNSSGAQNSVYPECQLNGKAQQPDNTVCNLQSATFGTGISVPFIVEDIGDVRFEVFMAVTMKNGVFWDVMPCGSCKNQRFGGT
jgi:hypothetical protein